MALDHALAFEVQVGQYALHVGIFLVGRYLIPRQWFFVASDHALAFGVMVG